MTTSDQTNLNNMADLANLESPMHVVLLKITMWLVLFLGLLGVMVVYMLN